ncbi:Fc.00g096010.m01.CDS01 [Cosmosporella sp. VM-42]
MLPAHDATSEPAAATETTQISWNAHFAAPINHTSVPAWTRVPIQPHAKTDFRNLIMKRVGLYMGKPTPTVITKRSRTPEIVEPWLLEAVEVPNPDRRVRPKDELYQKIEGDAQFEGQALSEAEVAHLIMAAKVDACNNYMVTSSDMTWNDRVEYQKGVHVQLCPQKRHFDYGEPNGKNYVRANKLTFYDSVIPIIEAATMKGLGEVDMAFAAIAEASVIMKSMRRDPRQRLAANGVPELSVIFDVTEPESPHSVQAPILKAESRSPRKRIAKLANPLKQGFRRLTKSFVKLSPTSSPKTSPSPTKSISAPSTPIRLSPSHTKTKTTATPAPAHSSPLSRAALTAPEELTPVLMTPSPGRVFKASTYESPALRHSGTFKAPSYEDSSSSDPSSSNLEQQSLVEQASSPVKYSRPVAPTPSRWNRAELRTQAFTPVHSTPSLLNDIEGISSLAPTTPQLLQPSYKLQTPDQVSTFSFGDVSPAFNHSVSWMNVSIQASEPQRVRNLNFARRRQSEPLQRTVFKMNARRQSGSSLKVDYQHDDTFHADTSMATLFTAHSHTSEAQSVDHSEHLDDQMHVDEQLPTIVENPATPEDHMHIDDKDAHMTGHHDETAEGDTTLTSSHSQVAREGTHMTCGSLPVGDGHDDDHPVLNIDMRRNPDIFGPATAVEVLAEMAKNDCEDHAQVQVTRENGRLVVRFKLPAVYADLFPETQGLDDKSQFSTSPSISNSPRIRFPPRQVVNAMAVKSSFGNSPAAVSSPQVGLSLKEAFDEMDIDLANQTIGMSFARSRDPNSDQSPWARDRYPDHFRQDATLVLDPTFGNTPARNESSMKPPSRFMQSANSTPNESVFDKTTAVDAILAPAFHAINGRTQDEPELPTPARPFGAVDVPTPSRAFDFSEMPTPSNLLEGVSEMPSPSRWGQSFNATPVVRQSYMDTSSRGQNPVPTPFQQVEPETSTLSVLDHTPSITGLGIVGGSQRGNLNTPSQNGCASLSPGNRTPLVRTPDLARNDQRSSPMFGHLTSSAKLLSPIEATPKGYGTSFPKDSVNQTTTSNTPSPPSILQCQQTPTQAAQAQDMGITPTPMGDTKSTPVNAPAATPSPKPSFTPVNQPTPQFVVTAPSNPASPAPSADKSTPSAALDTTTCRQQDYDSPGRDFLRDFIKRSRPKRSSTTETGSPIAPPNKRLPLEAKSPNERSPQKGKRKADAVEENGSSPVKTPKERAPKRHRREVKTKQTAQLAIDMNDEPSPVFTETPVQKTDDATNQDDTAEIDAGPSTRRSTRLRTQKGTSLGPKSSIPTSIKLNRSGAGRAGGTVLNSMVRSEQQDLNNQTRNNTRKNKGNSEYPKEVLAKFAGLSCADHSEEAADATTTTKSGKCVGWKDPLETVQSEKQPKKSKAAPKTAPKATLGKSGIAKPKVTSKTTSEMASQTKRTTKLAQNLGMVANGTPAKPQRMTRSRTRSQQS